MWLASSMTTGDAAKFMVAMLPSVLILLRVFVNISDILLHKV
jgi:hypothetical protein